MSRRLGLLSTSLILIALATPSFASDSGSSHRRHRSNSEIYYVCADLKEGADCVLKSYSKPIEGTCKKIPHNTALACIKKDKTAADSDKDGDNADSK